MAYGNWGAFVRMNGERKKNHEDNTPYEENERKEGYYQAFNMSGKLGVHHASLGHQDMRLCGYKCWPVLFHKGEKIDIEKYRIINDEHPKVDEYDEDRYYAGEIDGYTFNAEMRDNFVELNLKEPNGDIWTSTCGYQYGAGHMD